MNSKRKDFFTPRNIATGAMIAAIYAALTLVLAPLSYANIQMRVSEALTILPVLTPVAIPGLTVGCLIANVIGVSMRDKHARKVPSVRVEDAQEAFARCLVVSRVDEADLPLAYLDYAHLRGPVHVVGVLTHLMQLVHAPLLPTGSASHRSAQCVKRIVW